MSARVLLADPDEPLLQVYRQRLCQAGFEVAIACDGLTCVEALRHFEPDVLVLEPELPWGQGEGVLVYMREEGDVPLVPVIVLTGGANLLDGFQLPKFPVLERHQKPLLPDALTQCVRHVVGQTAVRH